MKIKKGMNKLFILFAVLLTLAMLIPAAAVSVSAGGSTDPANPAATLTPDPSHDIAGDSQIFTVNGMVSGNVTSFTVTGAEGIVPAVSQTLTPTGNGSTVTVQYSFVGEASIVANLSTGYTLSAVKKWGEINFTVITPPQNQVVTWIEATKSWTANATITDTVWGTFKKKNSQTLQYTDLEEFPANGAILNWFLLADNPANEALVAAASGSLFQSDVAALLAALALAPKATFTTFSTGGTSKVTVSGDAGTDGQSTVTLNATGEEPVLVVVLPWYPVSTQYETFIEWTKVNFWTAEMEKVPQVRWAGEKIVLEKYFGPAYAGALVRFSLENQSPGALEGLQGTQLGNTNNTSQSVWDVVSTGTDAGWARCMLVSEAPGEIDVDLALYNQYGVDTIPGTGTNLGQPVDPTMTTGSVLNQHGFVVFYLKLESVTLGNVEGKRAQHNSGLFDPANPVWDIGTNLNPIASPDSPTGMLNVSADTLLRARVKGWFMGDNMSSREAIVQDADPNNPGVYLYTLPKGRWVLPDDWPILAGPNWKEMRIHWDIMDSPSDSVNAPIILTDNLGMGAYYRGTTLVAAYPVIGPFRPGLEVPTATGYDPSINQTMATTYDDGVTANPAWNHGGVVGQKTVVPNLSLDWWDAPMPPAKITFKLQDVAVMQEVSSNRTIDIGDSGFFKDAFKTDIYYLLDPAHKIQYTSPFYWEMIPAFRWIPAFVNNGGYDWDSWNASYGPYQFWKIINRPLNEDMPAARPVDNANFPSKAQVYSDNHGEAMIYLNGNFGLNPALFSFKSTELTFGSPVGSTTVVAIADYPYFRKHNQLISTPVVKTWLWGGMVLGPLDNNTMILSTGTYTPVPADTITDGYSQNMMVWVWATDRDGMQAGVLGTQVDWSFSPTTSGVVIPDLTTHTIWAGTPWASLATGGGVSLYNQTMMRINITSGFLDNTMGGIVSTPTGPVYRSWMRKPTVAEGELFTKFYGTIIGADGLPLDPNNFVVAAIDLFDPSTGTALGSGGADIQVNAFLQSPDFGVLTYKWNVDFTQSHPLDDVALAGDANMDGKVTMADVTAIERIILGLNSPSYQADANGNDQVNMGDVVKTERIILGIK